MQEDGWILPTVDWLGYEVELGNFRSALARLERQGDLERTVSLAANINFWRFGQITEAWELWQRLMPRLAEVSKPTQARALMSASFAGTFRGTLEFARKLAEEALSINRELGAGRYEGECLWALATIAHLEGDHRANQSFASAAAAVFREERAQISLLGLLHDDGTWAMQAGDFVRARASLEESVEGAKELGATDEICNGLCDLGILELYEQHPHEALRLFAESLRMGLRSQWHINIAYTVGGAGCALATLGEVHIAARLLGAAEAIHERLEPIEQYAVRAYAEGSGPVRERLDEVELAAAWASGRAMSETDAATFALNIVTDFLANVPLER
jgi:hypothetical protein